MYPTSAAPTQPGAQAQAPTDSLAGHNDAAVQSVSGLCERLAHLRDRLAGNPSPSTVAGKEEAAPNVITMASTVRSRLNVAHDIMSEIEKIIG